MDYIEEFLTEEGIKYEKYDLEEFNKFVIGYVYECGVIVHELLIVKKENVNNVVYYTMICNSKTVIEQVLPIDNVMHAVQCNHEIFKLQRGF